MKNKIYYNCEELLTAASLIGDYNTTTLKEDCVSLIYRNRYLVNFLRHAVRHILKVSDEAVYSWQNTEKENVCYIPMSLKDLPMIDTLRKPFHLMIGGLKGKVSELLTSQAGLEEEPTSGFGKALTRHFIFEHGLPVSNALEKNVR